MPAEPADPTSPSNSAPLDDAARGYAVAVQKPPPIVLDLVERFDRNRDSYKSPQYNETQLRREFLDPLFKSLGWDIDNEQGYAEAYKDVIHEYSLRMGERTKAPDYCFRIGGTRKFYVEAKRPSIDIKNNAEPAFQLRRYAWTSKLPLGILTDFEEFAVYDCRVKPDHKDKAGVARILYIPYIEYAQRWGEIASVFSRDALLKGSFDKFAESNKVKRGTADVDEEFLKTIETWRSDLARNLAIRNPKLSQRELNFAVHRKRFPWNARSPPPIPKSITSFTNYTNSRQKKSLLSKAVRFRRSRRLRSGPRSPAPTSANPSHPSLTPEQAEADAAHFYSAKEEPPPYGKTD